MEIADPVLFMRDNEKCNISNAPKHRLERYSILNTTCTGVKAILVFAVVFPWLFNILFVLYAIKSKTNEVVSKEIE